MPAFVQRLGVAPAPSFSGDLGVPPFVVVYGFY
jgi:hypothetical protein